jgi:VWFA-related protein
LSQLIDAANRASVVVYAVDTKGMATLAFTAADDINTKLGNGDVQQADFNSARASRFLRNVESRQGLQQIAAETGGFLVQNQNDVSAGLGRILEDQGSYYLIGYVPDPSAYRAGREGPSFHKIKVKLKRPGLQVRSRSGFFGVVP